MPHLRYPRSGDRDTLEHVWPKACGGPDTLGNIALATHNCNRRRGSRPPTLEDIRRLHAVNQRLGWPTPMFVW